MRAVRAWVGRVGGTTRPCTRSRCFCEKRERGPGLSVSVWCRRGTCGRGGVAFGDACVSLLSRCVSLGTYTVVCAAPAYLCVHVASRRYGRLYATAKFG